VATTTPGARETGGHAGIQAGAGRATGVAPIDPIQGPFPWLTCSGRGVRRRPSTCASSARSPDGTTKNTAGLCPGPVAAAAQGRRGGWSCPRALVDRARSHLQSHVNLEVQTGAVILFSQTFPTYLLRADPPWEGLGVYKLLAVDLAGRDCTDVAVHRRR